jgi:hypothetical protein
MVCHERRYGTLLGAAVVPLLFLSMVSLSSAFILPSVALAPPLYRYPESNGSSDDSVVVDTSLVKTGPWRVALNLGREFSTPLWDSYGTSGIRFPVVIPCDFTSDGSVAPHSATVSYVADVMGGVTKPVVGGTWQITNNDKRLEFTLSFPEELQKKDVTIPAGSDLVMEVNLVSLQALKQLEEAFAEARKQEWHALEKIDEIQAIRSSPKRWNEKTQRWEYPRVEEPLPSLFSKHWDAFVKGQERRKKFAEKPRSGVELSKRPGRFPGFAKDDLVYFGTGGVIRNKSKGNMVVGTWAAEPIDSISESGTK